jgi:hypothetical protein
VNAEPSTAFCGFASAPVPATGAATADAAMLAGIGVPSPFSASSLASVASVSGSFIHFS